MNSNTTNDYQEIPTTNDTINDIILHNQSPMNINNHTTQYSITTQNT